jgi:tRNA pseudouridine13 synthase
LTDHPADFRGAFERVRVELRRIYLVAFQSHVWNRVLAEIVGETAPPDACAWIPSAFGELPAPSALTEERQAELERVKIPLPSSRARYADRELAARFERVLGEQGLTLATLRVKHGRDAFFPTASRAALLRPKDFESGWRDDELHPGRRALALAFTLPRGSYATIVLKRILAGRGRSYAADPTPVSGSGDDLDEGASASS